MLDTDFEYEPYVEVSSQTLHYLYTEMSEQQMNRLRFYQYVAMFDEDWASETLPPGEEHVTSLPSYKFKVPEIGS